MEPYAQRDDWGDGFRQKAFPAFRDFFGRGQIREFRNTESPDKGFFIFNATAIRRVGVRAQKPNSGL